MVAAAKKHNRVVQVGSQAHRLAAHQACTCIRNGMLGKVTKVTCWHSLNPSGGPSKETPFPPELDWRDCYSARHAVISRLELLRATRYSIIVFPCSAPMLPSLQNEVTVNSAEYPAWT